MTIDIGRQETILWGFVDRMEGGDHEFNFDSVKELCRLARAGEKAERERCGTCRSNGYCNIQPHADCYGGAFVDRQNWHCGDWEKKS